MPSTIRHRLLNRDILAIFVIELGIWWIWTQFLMRRPFGAVVIQSVMDFSGHVGQTVFGCQSLACIPYVFAGLGIFFYGIAVILGNLYAWGTDRYNAEPA